MEQKQVILYKFIKKMRTFATAIVLIFYLWAVILPKPLFCEMKNTPSLLRRGVIFLIHSDAAYLGEHTFKGAVAVGIELLNGKL